MQKLLTKEIERKLPEIGAANSLDDPYEAIVHLKLFSPYNGWRWFITEYDPEHRLAYGYVEGFESELGYIDLEELEQARVFGGLVQAVERDTGWTAKTLREVMNGAIY